MAVRGEVPPREDGFELADDGIEAADEGGDQVDSCGRGRRVHANSSSGGMNQSLLSAVIGSYFSSQRRPLKPGWVRLRKVSMFVFKSLNFLLTYS